MTTEVLRRVTSGSPYEAAIGFSRAVRVGGRVSTTLTGPVMPAGVELPDRAYDQGQRCLQILGEALGELGTGLEHVVRTEIYFVDNDDVDEICRLHHDTFGEVRPVTKILRTLELTDPRWKVEIELEAVVPGSAP
jgi:enamine deaminase RidA (YjgF/YER057c/UK114 family)